MCRLSFVSKKGLLTTSDKITFSTLTYLSERGGNIHGTGIAVNHISDMLCFVQTAKSAAPASTFVCTPEWVTALKGASHDVMSHTRLASAAFKADIQDTGAHPHAAGVFEVCHNGIFKEHARLAAENDFKGTTDSAIFAELLEKTVGREPLTCVKLMEVLKLVGEAEYCLTIMQWGVDGMFVVRGNRPLFWAKTSMGIIGNTDKVNLTDAFGVLSPSYAWVGHKVTVEEIAEVPIWTITHLANGEVIEHLDAKELKDINEKPVVKYGGVGQTVFFPANGQTGGQTGSTTTEWTSLVVERADRLAIIAETCSLSDIELRALCGLLFNKTMWVLTERDLDDLENFIGHLEDATPGLLSEERCDLWAAYSDGFTDSTKAIEQLYEWCSKVVGEFHFPWFLNENISFMVDDSLKPVGESKETALDRLYRQVAVINGEVSA